MKKVIGIILVIVIICLVVVMATVMVKGGKNENNVNVANSSTSKQTNSTSKQGELTEAEKFTQKLKNLSIDDVDKNAESQMAKPNSGDTIATIHVKDYGDIKVKFFENVAPMACENFITHAKEGYYNGLTFHRVIDEFVIQGGDPKGNGTGGESIWNEDFGEEFSETVLPYKGALCMASRGTGTKSLGSQFFIVQANYTQSMESYLYANLLNSYKKYGGDLYDLAIRYQYTTFGQVFEGLDIVDKIAETQTDSNDKPVQDVIISSIEISNY